MKNQVPFNSLLVPTDFSDNSWAAFQMARMMVDGDESEIVVVHAIDPNIIEHVVEAGLGQHDEILASMKKQALSRMKDYVDCSEESINIDTLVCEGEPFLEIIRKAEDFAVDAIVMSKGGQRSEPKSLLFGSTAEKVIRGSSSTVVVLPTK